MWPKLFGGEVDMTTARFPAIVIIAALIASSAGPAASGPQKPKEQAKVYAEALQGAMGQPFGKVVSMIEDWKFQALDAWEAVNPAAKEVARHNRNKVRFSKKEIAGIFGPGGTFRVVVYNKLVGTDSTTIGGVDASGMGAGKDLTVSLEKYTVIRAVFKDNILVLFKVWPVMEQSAMAGGMLLRR
jgi:hypothetical protein